jgi:hypothetical protein
MLAYEIQTILNCSYGDIIFNFMETQVELLESFKMKITSKCAQNVNHKCEFESKSSQMRGYYHLTSLVSY